MSLDCNSDPCGSSANATSPCPAVAPGADDIDVRRIAERLAAMGGVDPRVRAVVPGFDAPFFQAGLAGYSDAAMRIIARRHGCPYCVTEALLDRTLLAGGRGFAKADLGELHENVPGGSEDHPLAGQIMGSEPAEMAAAAIKMIEQASRSERAYRAMAYASDGTFAPTQHLRLPGGEQLGRVTLGEDNDGWGSCDPEESSEDTDFRGSEAKGTFQGADVPEVRGRELRSSSSPELRNFGTSPASFAAIDVNLACPVKKIERKARGGHWLAEPAGAIRILEAVREAVPAHIACTVKLRRSFDDTPEMAANVARIMDAACGMGYAWSTVHARTVAQKYVGPSRWDLLRDLIREVRRTRPDAIVFGSGDIWEAADIFRMVEYTGVQAAAVARGCIGNPWIFRQARDLMEGRTPRGPTIAEQAAVLRDHFTLLLAVNRTARRGEALSSRQIRKFGIRFAAHHPRGDEVRREMIAVESREDWEGVVRRFYDEA
ncbi:MAG: tRNA-dihydrouridine synthase family protein [Planctomycetota bacterium]|nr:tRNA-dihydrouridine synthase family protein [Planctomycetota bacterium]